MTDPQSKTIRTILEKALDEHLNEIGFKAGHRHLFIDQALSDISKIIDECVDGKRGEIIPFSAKQDNFGVGYATCQLNVKSNLKEALK